jgi:hypothetical protein
MRQWLCAVIVLRVLTAAFGVRAQAANELAGVTAILKSDRAFVPLRPVVEWFGAEISYVHGNITVTRGADTVTLTIGRVTAGKNGHTLLLDAAPFVLGGRAFVPLRFFAEAFGARVEYDAVRRDVTIADGDRTVSLFVTDYQPGRLTYMGAWFKVDYPASFSVIDRQASSSLPDRYEAASFVSPDGLVEFYVFSPQWRGDAEWVKLLPGEHEVERSTEQTENRRRTHVTLVGPNDSYRRSWVETVELLAGEPNTNHVFGIKYANQAAYDKYRRLYLQFKASLIQYAD